MGLPSSGGITVSEALNILENFGTDKLPREQLSICISKLHV